MIKKIKNRLKWIAVMILSPVFLISLIIVLLCIPSVQNFAARKVSKYISESIGMNINIGYFRLTYPLNIALQDMCVTDSNQDTIAYVKELYVNVRPRPLLTKNLSIRRFYLGEARIHSQALIEGIEIHGEIGSLEGHTDGISFINEEAIINQLKFSDSNLTIRIDSFQESDTAMAKMNWNVLVGDMQIDKLALSVQLPADSMQVVSYFENISLTDGKIDLNKERYELGQFLIASADIDYKIGNQPAKKGLDPSHIVLSKMNVCADSIVYQSDELQTIIQSFSTNEQSGLTIISMTGKIRIDDQYINMQDYMVKTPFSSVSAQLTVPLDIAEKNSLGFLSTQLTAVVDKRDLEYLMGELSDMITGFPSGNVLTLSGRLEGNLKKLYLDELQSEWPGVYRIDASGFMQEVMDNVSRVGTIDLTAAIQGRDLLQNVIPKQYEGRFSMPDTVWITMQAALQEGTFSADMLLSELQGQLKLSGNYNPSQEEYFVDLKADNIAPIHFLPQDSILLLSASLQAEGKGWDVFSDKTRTKFSGVLTEMQYKDMTLSGIALDGSLAEHKIQGTVVSTFPYVQGNLTIDGELQKERLAGMLIMDMDSLDLYGMKVTEKPFSNTFQIFSDFETDLQKRHQVDITLGNWDMFLSDQTISPKTLIFHAQANEDTTQLSLHAGDLGVIFAGNADAATLANKLMVVSDEVTKQINKDSLIDFEQLRPLFPHVNLRIEAQKDNPLYNYLQDNRIYFDRFDINTFASPENGLKVDGMLLSLIKDTTKIDTIRLDVWQDTNGIKYTFDVVKNKFRRQEAYDITLQGRLEYGEGDMEILFRNEQKETGILLGIHAEKQTDGVTFHLFPENPILAYQPFQLNENNFVKIKNLKDISANLRLNGEGNTALRLRSVEEDGKMQELSAEINAIDLNQLSNDFPQMLPSMQGMAAMSVRYVPEETALMIVVNANIDNLVYQGEKVGELLLNGVYLPLGNEEHQLDINLFHNQNPVSSLTALYQPTKNERIEGSFDVSQMELATLNPFLDGMARLNGSFQSSIAISGTAQQPLLDGYFKLDTASAYIPASGSLLHFDANKVEIKDNTIQFNRYAIHATGNNPLTIDGSIDLNVSNPVNSMADLRMAANNMQLFDSRKTAENLIYGRLFTDLRNFTARGPLSSLVMRGNLNVLGNTNMTYVMKDSPLAVQDRMANLVSFTYFRDTIPRSGQRTLLGERAIRESRATGGTDLLLVVRIEPTAKLTVELDEIGTNRVEMEGGGDLSYRYTPQSDMLLSGRYTFLDGSIRYNMPVISNKTLKIRENSYVDWNGDPMDPFLSLKATERIRANVSTEDGMSSRNVNFDAGIELRQRMENLSLQFTLEALDDATVQNRLNALGAEERGRRAVGLLLTGIFLDEDPSGRVRFDMGAALNSFLQTEINNITGSLLRGVDLNFGMENYDRMGMEGTNYSFRFSKRFYNDRFNVVLGGNVATGNVPNDNNTFINDASIEYRLDPIGNRYAKLFYNRQYESLLEGEITKYGGGIVFRRKIRRLGDLFLFAKKKTE